MVTETREGPSQRMFCLLDANVLAAYYHPGSTRNQKMVQTIRRIIESVRSGASEIFLYIPNLCIAEVFSTFMKYSYSGKVKRRLDERVHKRIRQQFQADIHNAKLFYHYEVSRYHILAINLIAPIEHHFQMYRRTVNKTTGSKRKSPCAPAGIVDQLIIAMGVHLAKIHGSERVFVLSSDERIVQILRKCKNGLSQSAVAALKLKDKSEFVGIPFEPASFPGVINLKDPKKSELRAAFGQWPLPLNSISRREQPKWADRYDRAEF